MKECGVIRIEEVTFDPLYAGQQVLSLEVSTVNKFILDSVEIKEALQVIKEIPPEKANISMSLFVLHIKMI